MANDQGDKVLQLFPATQEQLGDDLKIDDSDPNIAPEEPTMASIDIKDYVDARTDMVRAQNDARFAELLTEIRTVGTKLDHVPNTRTMIATTIATAAGAIGVVLSVLAFAGDRFDGGISASSIVRDASLAQQQKFDTFSAAQKARDEAQDAKVETILNAIEGISNKLDQN